MFSTAGEFMLSAWAQCGRAANLRVRFADDKHFGSRQGMDVGKGWNCIEGVQSWGPPEQQTSIGSDID
eukprot:6638124-Pyramimonas_sp.AAC.1